jgi:hypothetical protein
MNLKNWIWNWFATGRARCVRPGETFFGQSIPPRLESLMPSSLFPRRAVVCLCWIFFLAIPTIIFGQTNYYAANGTEYAVIGSLPGDQVFPDAAVTPSGGFMVWQDNITDGDGFGISARRLDGTLSGTLSTFRVNQQGANDQQNPRVALLKNGGAVFTWQGGKLGYQHIYARFLNSSSTFLTTTDVLVSVPTNNFQINPAMAVLNNSNVVVVWGSFNQVSSNSFQDVYGQIFSQTGQPIGTNFLINQFTSYNQRTPSIAALKNGGFVVAWVSEQQRAVAPALGTPSAFVTASAAPVPSVDVYARLYDGNAVAQGGEFLVNTDSNPAADPAVAAAADGSFMVAWCAHDMANSDNGLDIFARPFSSAGVGGTVLRVNSHLYGDQFAPRINSIGTDYLVAWTSLAQDGSREGVYAQFLHGNGSTVGGEFRVNTTTISQQMQPVVASDGVSQFLVIWTSYTGSPNSFDLFAQRYINVASVLQPISAVFVYAPFVVDANDEYQPQLQVSWPTLLGISVSNYEVYVNGSSTPSGIVTSNQWTMTAANGLTASTTNSFQVDYTTTDGRRSPLSPSASGKTWSDCDWGGIPCDWMKMYFGANAFNWPSPTADSDGDGMNNLQEFLAGTSPTNAASALRVQLASTPQGLFLNWNTQPGATYQVQTTTNFTTWNNLGASRFAAGGSDSIFVGGGSAGYYRVLLLRQ